MPWTRQLHYFHHVSLFKVKVSQFSSSTQTRQETMTAEEHVIRFEGVKGYVTVFSMMEAWNGHVLGSERKRGGY